MERLLHYVWKYRLYLPTELTTIEGLPITVIDPGTGHSDAGPDFFNAKIKIGDTLWAGGVEIHSKASDWFAHKHDKDKAYDSVILHVVGAPDAVIRRSDGKCIPQMRLSVPTALKQNIDRLLRSELDVPCISRISEIDPIHLSAWTNALLSERLERKTGDVLRLVEQYKGDWNEAFYITLTRSFGFGLNNDAFERLAKSLPFQYIRKQRFSQSQIEAMLLGQAGLLETDKEGHYYRLLQQEYRFLCHKFGLTPLESFIFKSLRVRPVAFPHVKLAQLAALWHRYDTLFSILLEEEDIAKQKALFNIHPSDYWETHYHFNEASPKSVKTLGTNAINIVLINTVVPMLFAWGQQKKRSDYCDRAIRLLESIPAERNQIVKMFCRAGMRADHAGDSQALVQLKREYCEKKKCLYCRIGFALLKRAAR